MPENPTVFSLEAICPKTVGVSDLRSSGHLAVWRVLELSQHLLKHCKCNFRMLELSQHLLKHCKCNFRVLELSQHLLKHCKCNFRVL